jgi:hypothetical protein
MCKVEVSTKSEEIFFLDSLEDGEGVRKIRKFLQSMVENFKTEMFSFYDQWGEFPFIYSEKQLGSILAPAIHKHTGSIWFEQPFKKDKNTTQRFLDIAVSDKENTYLIELKHSWMNFSKGKITKGTDDKWEKCIEQIVDIKRVNMKSYFNFEDNQIFRIALMIMPTYENVASGKELEFCSAKDYCKTIVDHYANKSKKYHTNFTATIKINNPKEYELELDTGKVQIYPYISFIAKIERVN